MPIKPINKIKKKPVKIDLQKYVLKGWESSGYYLHFEGELILKKIERFIVVIMRNKKH